MRPPLYLLALALLGCGTTRVAAPAPVLPVDVQHSVVEVHVPCKAKEMLGPEPEYEGSDDALRAVPFPMAVSEEEWVANWFFVTKLLSADRLQRIRRDMEKTAVLEGC